MVATNKNKETDNNNGLDEKGSPKPLTNPQGGDPICPGGWKLDNDFDVFDPINPPFTCISALKDPSDSNQINKIMNNLNNPSNNITGLATNQMKPIGGGMLARRRSRRSRNTRTRTRTRMNVKHARSRSRSRSRRRTSRV